MATDGRDFGWGENGEEDLLYVESRPGECPEISWQIGFPKKAYTFRVANVTRKHGRYVRKALDLMEKDAKEANSFRTVLDRMIAEEKKNNGFWQDGDGLHLRQVEEALEAWISQSKNRLLKQHVHDVVLEQATQDYKSSHEKVIELQLQLDVASERRKRALDRIAALK